MLKVVTAPNAVLSQKAKPVKKIDDKIKKLIQEMKKTLDTQKNPQGVGLAAPQVGVSLALFIIKPEEKTKIGTFMNPRIIETRNNPTSSRHSVGTSQGQAREEPFEGCLSIPKIWSPLKRPQKVLLEYQDINGNLKQEWFTGFKAVIIQHEVDHLQGVVFTQRALEQKVPLYEEKDNNLEKVEFENFTV